MECEYRAPLLWFPGQRREGRPGSAEEKAVFLKAPTPPRRRWGVLQEAVGKCFLPGLPVFSSQPLVAPNLSWSLLPPPRSCPPPRPPPRGRPPSFPRLAHGGDKAWAWLPSRVQGPPEQDAQEALAWGLRNRPGKRLPPSPTWLPGGRRCPYLKVSAEAWDQKKGPTRNQTSCYRPAAALEKVKTSGVPGSPQTPPESRDPGDSLPQTPQLDSHSEEDDGTGAGGAPGGDCQASRTQSPEGSSVEAVLGRKKHRRRPTKRKRHWRPYLELSWAEKQQRDEWQGQRASRVREEMFAKGQPVAPYNTTQFLMNDRDPEEPNLDVPHGASHPGSSGDSEAGDSDGHGPAHGEFQQRDFSEAYERYHAESLQGRSKQELVRDYLDLERRLSQAEEETHRLQQLRGAAGHQPCRQVEALAAEVERLRTENQRLRLENEMWNHRKSSRMEGRGEPGT